MKTAADLIAEAREAARTAVQVADARRYVELADAIERATTDEDARGSACEDHLLKHGAEAKALRQGVEELVAWWGKPGRRRADLTTRLRALLDRVDAGESIAWLEEREALKHDDQDDVEINPLSLEAERDAALASAAALREALARLFGMVKAAQDQEVCRNLIVFYGETAAAALADNSGAALLERLRAAEAKNKEWEAAWNAERKVAELCSGDDFGQKMTIAKQGADLRAAEAERDRLAAQLLQDAPLASAARAYEEAHEAWYGSPADTIEERLKGERMHAALSALLDLAREQKGGA